MRVVLASAAAVDAEAIAALHTASWRTTYRGILPDTFLDDEVTDNRLRMWRERMQAPAPGQIVLKAVVQGELCGFACTFLDADEEWGALLDNLHVTPSLTGHGVGKQLLDGTFARVRAARPGRGLHLWVFEANAGARRFYERHGARAVERKRVELLPGVIVPEVRYAWDG